MIEIFKILAEKGSGWLLIGVILIVVWWLRKKMDYVITLKSDSMENGNSFKQEIKDGMKDIVKSNQDVLGEMQGMSNEQKFIKEELTNVSDKVEGLQTDMDKVKNKIDQK